MRAWWLLALSVLLCLIVYAGLQKFGANDVPLPDAIRRLHIQDCAPSDKPCLVQLDTTVLTVQLEPSGLPAMEPLLLRIDAAPLMDLRIGRVWFEGRDMDMGMHYLEPVSDTDGLIPVWRGVIPVCSVDSRMVWQLKLLLEVGSKQQLIVFDLVSDVMTEQER